MSLLPTFAVPSRMSLPNLVFSLPVLPVSPTAWVTASGCRDDIETESEHVDYPTYIHQARMAASWNSKQLIPCV